MEFRFDLAGRAAVRVCGGPVAPRHVEPAPPSAPWVVEARCGSAVGWLLAAAPPDDPAAAQARLQATVDRRTALALQALLRAGAVHGAGALEQLTHRLRTDVMTLQTVAEAALGGHFEPEERAEVAEQVAGTAREAQRRLTDARAVMSVLAPAAPAAPESIAGVLRAEFEAAGRTVVVSAPTGEEAFTLIPGAGWAGCARRLAADERWHAFAITPDPAGWRVTASPPGELAVVGQLVAAAGGSTEVTDVGISLFLPAAVPD